MAARTIVELVDDLDGTVSEDITTVTFGLDGAGYEIDLTGDNADRLRAELADFVAAARRTGGRRNTGRSKRIATATSVTAPTTNSRPAMNREHTKAVRDWARQNGYELGDRGRIRSDILEAFDAAHATNGGKGKKVMKPEPAFSN
jgi:Lsr2